MGRLVLVLLVVGLAVAHDQHESRLRKLNANEIKSASQPNIDRADNLRFDGVGSAGAKLAELLRNINNLAKGVQRVGSSADAATASNGLAIAQRRATSALLRTLPLSTSATSIGGATEIAPTGQSGFTANSTSIARDVVSDNNGSTKSFGASSIAEGFTTAQSTSTPAASTTSGSATTAAGEKALTQPRVLDGGAGGASLTQQGVGDRVSTKLQTATLSALSADKDKAQIAGGFLFASADSRDGPTSATRDFGKPSNTAATLSTNGAVNRFGYGTANDAADVRVDSTDTGSARVFGGRFGTGFNFGAVTTLTSTYPSQRKSKD